MSVRQQILSELIKNSKTGLNDHQIMSILFGNAPTEAQQTEYVSVVNALLTEGRLIMLQRGNESFYKAKTDEEVEKLQGLSQAQVTIYNFVEQKGKEGIWKKRLKELSGLPEVEFNKALKHLETKHLVKPFKSIQSKNKIFYILFELTPSDQHSGDIWITSDMELDREFIDVLSKYIYDVIVAKEFTNNADLLKLVNDSQISKVQLEPRHIDQLVNALYFDGKVEYLKNPKTTGKHDAVLIKPTRLTLPYTGLTSVPCGTCPVFDLCSENGDINPRSCQYLSEWLGTN